MVDVFIAAGLPKEDAEICAEVPAESDRRGIDSHGCNRFKPIYIDRINEGILNPVTEYEVLKETPTTLVVDAHDGMGMATSYKAMKTIIYTVGEKEYLVWLERKDKGVPVNVSVQKDLMTVRDMYGLDYKFTWE